MFSHSCIRKFFASWLCGMLLLLGVGSADAANPQGKLESYGTLPNMLRVIGWAYDQDDMNHKTRVHVYVGGTAGSNVPSFEIRADKNHKQYPGHGFDQTVKIPTEWCGKRTIHVYALNDVGSGAFQEIGSLVVDIPAPKEQSQSARTGTVKGDVNNDGKVDDADLQLLERYHLGLVTSLPNKDAADMNGDGKISLIDISRLQTIVQQTQPKAVMLKDGWYQIAPSHDLGRVLDVWGLSKENGANLTVHSINGGNNQKFYLQNRGNGYFSLKAGHCDLYVTAEGRSAGANLVMRGWNGSDVQLFKLISGGNGIHHIVAKVDANLNFDCAGGQKQDGNNVQLWTKENNSAWHKWKFTSTSAPAPIVTNHNPQGGVSQIDSPGDYTLHVKGTAFDEDNLNGNVRVHIYVGGTAGANPNEVPQFELRAANQGGEFVFEGTQNIGNKKTGNQTVHVYALNDYGAGSFQEIWSGNVNIKGGSNERNAWVKTNGSTLRLRAQANTSSAVLEKLANGTQVKELEQSGNWSKVRTESGRTGYVASQYLVYEQPVPPSDVRERLMYAVFRSQGAYISCDFDGYVNTKGRHEGIDMVLSHNAPVYAAISGVVTRAGGSLNTVAIYDETNDKTVVYLHFNSVSVRQGQYVNRGVLIGRQGKTGASASHVHIEVRDGKRTAAAKSVNDYNLENSNPYDYWNAVL